MKPMRGTTPSSSSALSVAIMEWWTALKRWPHAGFSSDAATSSGTSTTSGSFSAISPSAWTYAPDVAAVAVMLKTSPGARGWAHITMMASTRSSTWP